jgi:hypothetical protein
MANKKISELLSLDTVGANLQLTIIPVLDTATGTTRKVTLQQLNDSIEANIPFAAAAFTQANTPSHVANSASSYANGAFTRANTPSHVANSASSYANAAYGVANTANTNSVNSGTYANAAYGAANTADQRAVTSGVYANAAYGVANTANTNSVNSGTYANAAYGAANTATTNAATADQKAVTSGAYANAAYGQANTSNTLAQQSYNTANTKVSKSGDTMTGNLKFGGGGGILNLPTNQIAITANVDNDSSGFIAQATGVSTVYANTDVIIQANTGGSTFSQWYFNKDGILTLPSGGTVKEGTSPTGVGRSIVLTPDGASVTQSLSIYPTAAEGDHIHLTAGGGSTELYLGNDNQYVKLVNGGNIQVQATNGAANNVYSINSQGGYNIGSYTGLSTTGGSGTGLTVNASTAGNGYINTINIVSAGSGYLDGDFITLVGGDGLGCTFNINIIKGTWTFGANGALTLPDTSNAIGVLTSSFTGNIAGTTLTVTNATPGTIAWEQSIEGPGVAPDTFIITQLTGTSGGNGTYSVTVSQNVGPVTMNVASVYLNGSLKLGVNHAIYQQDEDDASLYNFLIGIEAQEATIHIGDINTNGVCITNDKEYKVHSALNPNTFMAVAKVDANDSVILSSGNANTTQLKVGGLGTGYAMKFNNGGQALIPIGLRIGDNTNASIFAAPFEVGSILGAAANNQSNPAGVALPTYRGTGTLIANDEWGSYVYGSRYRGTINSPLPTKDGDWLMEFGATSFDGTNNGGGGEMAFRVDGAVTGSANPSRWELYVTPAGTNSQTLGLKVDSSLQTTLYGNLKFADTTVQTTAFQNTSPSINTSITTPSTTFNLINGTATTVNFAGGSTTLSIGANTGTTIINNNLRVSSNATVNALAATATISSTASSLGYLGVPQNSKATNYTTVIGDSGKHIYVTSTSTITIDSNTNVAYPIGTTIGFIAGPSATVTIAITSDTMYLGGTGTTGSRTLAAYGMATAIKVAATTWFISGNGLT